MGEPSPVPDVAADRLREHPWVASVHEDERSVRVALVPEVGAADVGGWRETVSGWGEVYDHVYAPHVTADGGVGGQGTDPGELAGWRSSIDGSPFPAEVMREWVERTGELVAGLHPRVVVEVGCGTGMIMRGLIGRVEHYLGLDVSSVVIDRLRPELPTGFDVTVGAAHELGSIARRWRSDVDTVIVNSVTQHFPCHDYLDDVIAQAISVVEPVGSVFIGDVRDARLETHAARWVAARQHPGGEQTTIDDTARRMIAREDELLVDPVGLAVLAAGFTNVTLRAHVKPLAHDTELSRYRFDAILDVDPAHAQTDRAASSRSLPRVTGLQDVLELLGAGDATEPAISVTHPWSDPQPGAEPSPSPSQVLSALGTDFEVFVAADSPGRYEVHRRDAGSSSARLVAPLGGDVVRREPLTGAVRQAAKARLLEDLEQAGTPLRSRRLIVERSVDV